VFGFLLVWFGINLLGAVGFSLRYCRFGDCMEAHVGGFLFGFLAFSLFDPIRHGQAGDY
jgi:membrane associated rhomboid family serine protease